MTSSVNRVPVARGMLRRFRRDRKGATAVEFGLLAMPFFFILFLIVEMAMVFWTRQILQESVSQAARTILTGQSRSLYTGTVAVQTAAFRKAICARMTTSSTCESRLFIDVQPVAAGFPAAQAASMISDRTINADSFMMRPVAEKEVAIIRVAYTMPVFSPGFFGQLARLNTGENVVQAVVAFKAEPYSS